MGWGDTILTDEVVATRRRVKAPADIGTDEPKRKGRAAKAEKLPKSTLALALQFVSICSRDTGLPYQQHTALAMRQAMAFDGVTAAGYPIAEDIAACPNTERFLDALERCKGAFSMTLEGETLTVAGGKFRARVPVLGFEQMTYVAPDPAIAPLDDRIKVALKAVNPLVKEAASRVVEASALIRANTVVATDGKLAIEHWHGIDLPPGLVVPKSFINAVVRCDEKLTGFGWTANNSITFWFENGAWIKTQLYQEGYPDIDRVLNIPSPELMMAPKHLFEACEAVSGFNDGTMFLKENRVTSHLDDQEGASYDVPGLLTKPTQTAWYQMKLIRDLATAFDFTGETVISWQGELARGKLARSIPPQ